MMMNDSGFPVVQGTGKDCDGKASYYCGRSLDLMGSRRGECGSVLGSHCESCQRFFMRHVDECKYLRDDAEVPKERRFWVGTRVESACAEFVGWVEDYVWQQKVAEAYIKDFLMQMVRHCVSTTAQGILIQKAKAKGKAKVEKYGYIGHIWP